MKSRRRIPPLANRCCNSDHVFSMISSPKMFLCSDPPLIQIAALPPEPLGSRMQRDVHRIFRQVAAHAMSWKRSVPLPGNTILPRLQPCTDLRHQMIGRLGMDEDRPSAEIDGQDIMRKLGKGPLADDRSTAAF